MPSTNNTYKTNYCLTFSPGRRQWRQPCPAYPQSLGPRWSRQCQRTWQTRSREKLSITLSRNPTFSSYECKYIFHHPSIIVKSVRWLTWSPFYDNIIIIWSDHQMMINVSDYQIIIIWLYPWHLMIMVKQEPVNDSSGDGDLHSRHLLSLTLLQYWGIWSVLW